MNIVFKLLTIYYSTYTFFQRKVFIKGIKKDDLVLDVGSGDKPFWRADVIVDKYLEDDQQRHSGAMVYDQKKYFIEADVEKLPFKDKVFDFVFCAHLLEHVKNPDIAIAEITRVAKSGYIEVPDGIVDLFQPFPPHLWFCHYKDGVLYFMQKEKKKNYFIELTETFGKEFYNKPLFQFLQAKYLNHIFICLYWKDTVKNNVIRVKNPYVYTYKINERHEKNISTKVTFAIYKLSYILMTTFFYKKKKIDTKTLLER